MREHHGLLFGDRDPAAARSCARLARRLGRVAGTKAHDPDPGHVLDHRRRLLVLADEQQVAGRGVRMRGGDGEVEAGGAVPWEPGSRQAELGVAECDHGVVSPVADGLTPRGAERDRPAALGGRDLPVGGDEQRRHDLGRVGVGVPDPPRVAKILGVGGQLQLGEGDQPVARPELGHRCVGLGPRPEREGDARNSVDRNRLDQLRPIGRRADRDLRRRILGGRDSIARPAPFGFRSGLIDRRRLSAAGRRCRPRTGGALRAGAPRARGFVAPRAFRLVSGRALRFLTRRAFRFVTLRALRFLAPWALRFVAARALRFVSPPALAPAVATAAAASPAALAPQWVSALIAISERPISSPTVVITTVCTVPSPARRLASSV